MRRFLQTRRTCWCCATTIGLRCSARTHGSRCMPSIAVSATCAAWRWPGGTIAAFGNDMEKQRSGTWRRARRSRISTVSRASGRAFCFDAKGRAAMVRNEGGVALFEGDGRVRACSPRSLSVLSVSHSFPTARRSPWVDTPARRSFSMWRTARA